MKALSWFILLFLCQPVFSEADCSTQGVPPGMYTIGSMMNDGRCIDKNSEDKDSIQFYFCNGSANQKFTFGEKDAKGCYRIRVESIPGPDYRYVVMTTRINALDPFFTIMAVPLPSNPELAAWWIRSDGAGAYTIQLAADFANRYCMDRKNPDDQGRAIAKACSGVIEQRFSIQPTALAPVKKSSTCGFFDVIRRLQKQCP